MISAARPHMRRRATPRPRRLLQSLGRRRARAAVPMSRRPERRLSWLSSSTSRTWSDFRGTRSHRMPIGHHYGGRLSDGWKEQTGINTRGQAETHWYESACVGQASPETPLIVPESRPCLPTCASAAMFGQGGAAAHSRVVGPCAATPALKGMDWRYITREVSRPCPGGDLLAARFSAYVYDADGRTFWDITALTESLLAYRKTLQTWNHILKERPNWEHIAELFGLDFSEHYQASKRQCQRVGGSQPGHFTRGCQTMSTELLVYVLLNWIVWSRIHKMRERAALIFNMFLGNFAPPQHVALEGFDGLVQDASADCDHGRGCGGIAYRHLSMVALDSQATTTSAQKFFMSSCQKIYPLIGQCGAARSLLARIVRCLAEGVQQRLEEAEQTAPHKLEVQRSASGRARPCEDTYRAQNLRALMRSQRAKNGKGVLNLDGYHPSVHMRWVSKDRASYAVASARVFHGVKGVFAVFEDAARLGNPAREIVIYLTWSCTSKRGAAMPPQAFVLGPPLLAHSAFSVKGPLERFTR